MREAACEAVQMEEPRSRQTESGEQLSMLQAVMTSRPHRAAADTQMVSWRGAKQGHCPGE